MFGGIVAIMASAFVDEDDNDEECEDDNGKGSEK